MARDSLRISAAQRQRLRNLLRRARETSCGIWHRNRDLVAFSLSPQAGRGKESLGTLAAIAVFGILADVLDGDHMLVFGGVEHDDALGRAARDPDALDRTADQLAPVGHQHDLVAVLDRE